MSSAGSLRFRKLWVFLGGCGLLLILWASLVGQEGEPRPIPHLDKFLHFFVYATACWYFCQALPAKSKRRISLWLFCYGGLIEILQFTTATRSAEWGDLASNAAGVYMGALLSSKLMPDLIARIDGFLDRIYRQVVLR